MVLRRPPEWDETPGVVARRVGTAEESGSVEIAAAAFETPDHERDEVLADVERRFREQGVRGAAYLAWVDGEPVAQAYAAFTEHGLLLFGGGTLPGSRAAAPTARSVRTVEDAVARGTPALVTHAGAMSRPILRRLGFEERSEISILLDRFGERDDPSRTEN